MPGLKARRRRFHFLRLGYVLHAARWSLKRATDTAAANKSVGDFVFSNPSLSFNIISARSQANNANKSGLYVDADFAGLGAAIAETGFDPETGTYSDANIDHSFDTNGDPDGSSEPTPTMYEVESIFLSLIQQTLLRGFVLHANPRFAIPGSQRYGGPVQTGFPNVWETLSKKSDSDAVPGWVRMEDLSPEISGIGGMASGRANTSMAGKVVRLSGARPVGAGG